MLFRKAFQTLGQASPQPPSHRGGQYYMTGNKKIYTVVKNVQNVLKKNLTPAEKILWEYLRGKATGHKIRRQHIISGFVADFICLEKQTIIEIDGSAHNSQKEHDALRTKELEKLGFTIIRFSNQEVVENPEKVAKNIQTYLTTRESGTPPSMGGGLGGGLPEELESYSAQATRRRRGGSTQGKGGL